MKVITLARKPFKGTVATNMLTHGCGGINIKVCRIGTAIRESAQKDFSAVWGNRFGSGEHLPTTGSKEVSGRWPANLILQHLEGCRRDGMKIVKGSFLDHECTDGDLYGKYAPAKKQGHTDKNGKEAVDNWVCIGGCPVKAMGEHSGELVGKVGMKQHGSGTNAVYGHFERSEQSTTTNDGTADIGTAARFFKQVKP